MATYQGRALRAAEPRRRGTARGTLLALLALATLAGAALGPPGQALRRRLVVTEVRIEGLHYLDPERVARIAGVHRGDDLIGLDPTRVRQRLLLEPRIAEAFVRRTWTGVRIRVVERRAVLLVLRGEPWELDSAGVLLRPLSDGVLADVPLLAGARADGLPSGATVSTEPVRRGLAWAQALAARELELGGRISEIDVSEARTTALELMTGTRVLTQAWPPDRRSLSALRVVLADLERRGRTAGEVDLRYEDQVIVRPLDDGTAPIATPAGTAGG